MPYKTLYLFVEGNDDERFATTVIVPPLRKHYASIDVSQYAQKKPAKVNAYLRSIKSMGGEYFFLGDINASACFPAKKRLLLEKFAELDADRVIIVVKEVESWYLAGVPGDNPWGLNVPAATSALTKEQFDAARPKTFISRPSYMVELLKVFDVNTAAARNPSFQYFARRCGLLGSLAPKI